MFNGDSSVANNYVVIKPHVLSAIDNIRTRNTCDQGTFLNVGGLNQCNIEATIITANRNWVITDLQTCPTSCFHPYNYTFISSSSTQGNFSTSLTAACAARDCLQAGTCTGTGINGWIDTAVPQLGYSVYPSNTACTPQISTGFYVVNIGGNFTVLYVNEPSLPTQGVINDFPSCGASTTINTLFAAIGSVTGPIPIASTTPSPTPSVTPSVTPTRTPSVTPSVTRTPSVTPTITSSVTPSVTPSITSTITPSLTPSISLVPSETPSVTPSLTPSLTPSETPSISVTPDVTPSVTPSLTPSETPSVTPTIPV